MALRLLALVTPICAGITWTAEAPLPAAVTVIDSDDEPLSTLLAKKCIDLDDDTPLTILFPPRAKANPRVDSQHERLC